ncbi:MAG: hypothetical protein QXP98_05095 [Thermoproteus sp.]
MKATYILVGVLVVLAAVFAALWYGAYVENNSLKGMVAQLNAQINSLEGQYANLQQSYQNLSSRYSQLNSQYNDLQNKYGTLQNQYATLQSQYASLQSQYSQLQSQYTNLQNQYSTLNAQYSALQSQYSQLQSQYADLQNKVNVLKQYVYGGRDLVNQFKAMLQNVQLNTPTVGNSWTFENSYTLTNITLPPRYYMYNSLQLSTYDTLVVSVSDPSLTIMIMSPSQFDQYRQTGVRNFLASGYGSLSFTPSQNGTYYIVVVNDGSTTSTFARTYTLYETWYYCGSSYSSCGSPNVVGVPGTPSYDFFRLMAIYNYWFNNRHDLAQAVLAIYPNLTTVEAYTLSLAALLKSAGFDVTFAAVSTSYVNPFSPDSAQVAVVFNSAVDPTDTFYSYLDTLPIRGYHVITSTQQASGGYNFYVIIDTYYVHDIYDLGKSSYTVYNVIYLDGETQLP